MRASSGQQVDYYWRDYTGYIPKDAVEGGLNKNQMPTYVGQVYIYKKGICPVTIYRGNKTVVPSSTGTPLSDCIKILCSQFKEKFKWVPTDAPNFHVNLITKHLVVGGVDNDRSITNIGRILHKGEIVVAKVTGSKVGNAKLYYRDDNKEKTANTYEVLTYE